MPGVTRVVVDLEKDMFTVSYNEKLVETNKILESIEGLGFLPRLTRVTERDARR